MKLLVTGFENFNGFENPTKKIAKALDGQQLNGVQIKGIEIPVNWRDSWPIINQYIETFAPDALVSFGLNTSISGIEIETKAYNIQGHIKDTEGNYPAHSYVQSNGPHALPTYLPADYLSTMINNAQGKLIKILPNYPEGKLVGASLSNNAGNYLCNHVFYNSIYHQKEHLFIKGFIHMQGIQHGNDLSDLIQSGAFTINALTQWMTSDTLHTTSRLIN
ncbi:MAG: hypothetical protein ACRBFS_25415 [Aureispira sp.]